MTTNIQENQLLEVSKVIELILEGKVLVLSGEEDLLLDLPKGKWIGGTIPYFYIKNEHGRIDKSKIFVTDFSDWIIDFKIQKLNIDNLNTVCISGFENGFNFLILPALKDIHLSFALNAPNYENLYTNPLIGLIAGVDLSDLAKGKMSKTFNGQTGSCFEDEAVVLQCQLPNNKVARLEIINVFEPQMDTYLEFVDDSFTIKNCIINGESVNLYDYIKANNIDISFPLVSDYGGANINVSFQALNDITHDVVFYAPLFKNKKYHFSNKFANYHSEFISKVEESLEKEKNVLYNCNCILNYLYGDLENHDIGFSGPATFGEIAYLLLNQTFTYLSLDEN